MSFQLRRSTRKRKCVDFSSDQIQTPTRNSSSGDPNFSPSVHMEKINVSGYTITSSSESHDSNISEDESPIPDVPIILVQRTPNSLSRILPSPCTSPFVRKLMSSQINTSKSPVKISKANVNTFYGSISKRFDERAEKLAAGELSFSSTEENEIDAIDAMRKIVKPSRQTKGRREKRVLISQNSVPNVTQKMNGGLTKEKSISKPPKKKTARKPQGNSFMKRSMLETRQPEVQASSLADELVRTPVKRKFFSSSAKEKQLMMTTTLFGKQKISAATALNKPQSVAAHDKNVKVVPSIQDIPKNSTPKKSDGKTVIPAKKAERSPESIICNTNLHSRPQPTEDNVDPIQGEQRDDSVSSNDEQEPSDAFSISLASSNKENQSMRSLVQLSGSESPVQEQRSFNLRSPIRQAVMQHYHYSPPSKANSSHESDCPSASNSPEIGSSAMPSLFSSPIADARMANLVDNTNSDGSFEEIISGTPQKRKRNGTGSINTKSLSARKQIAAAWPIHYSAEKEKLSNLKSKTSPSTSFTNKSRSKNKDCKEQLIIDAGQKEIGAKMCFECGMFYNPDSDEDVGLHIKVHNTVITNLRFQGWKKERVVREFIDGRVLLILSEDPKFVLKKVDDVKQVMDTNLGFHKKAQPDRHTMQVYFFVMEKKIVGCLIAETIKQAFKVIPSVNDSVPLSCSTQPEKALCGVNRIWTLATHRRRSIASRLIDCMRTRFYFGCEVSKEQIAFSDPTPDGRKFAAEYTRSENFLVYK